MTDVHVEVNADNHEGPASKGGAFQGQCLGLFWILSIAGVLAIVIGLGVGLGMDDNSSSITPTSTTSRTVMKQSIIAPVSSSRRAEAYSGNVKKVYEAAYLSSLGLSTAVASIQSAATADTPTTSTIDFVLNVNNNLLKSATSKAKSLTTEIFASAVNSAISLIDTTVTRVLTTDITVNSLVEANNFCVQGVCQVTSLAETWAGIQMNLLGAAKYFWAEASADGTMNYALDTEAYVSFARVKSEMAAMPKKFHNKEAFKPNDLGLLRLNGEIFSFAENPVIGLAMSTEQHAKEAKTFLTARKVAGNLTQTDISAWCQKMLHKYGLKHDISLSEAAAFQSYGKSALANSILPYATFKLQLIKDKLKTSDVRAENAAKLNTYADLTKKRCPFMQFSDSDAKLVAHGLVDGALTFAGGISVPGIITSMLAVLYSGDYGDYSNPAVYSSSAFAWEVVRFFPAVVGVPFVKTGTTKRQACLIPGALSDKSVWGNDAFEFKLRADSVYDSNIDVAWSGFTDDKKYPNDSHSCPGMGMSKAMLLGFMKALKYSDWSPDTKPKQVTQAPVAWNSFFLKSK